ncbi:MAG: PUR family DNA/RNA-binding protein [Candidatus Shikimatogenerans bostrichidophilus]|nr:MAG: PUR family DNA/RNA-binding protein [Candidatus Shikimatogenerans bostrichidophilus]
MVKEDKNKSNNYIKEQKEIYSKILESGNRRYFFDIKETNLGDYFLSITESKKFFLKSGRQIFKKHKIFLYKDDFKDFKKILCEMIDYVFKKKIKIKKNKEEKEKKKETIKVKEINKKKKKKLIKNK